MKLGLALPSFVDDPEIPIRVAHAAQDAGLDGVFVYDHLWRGRPPARRPALECFALAGAIATETATIAVGTLVARATLRPPATLAVSFDALHRVSGGRLIAAIGAGDSESRTENEAYGLAFGTVEDRVGALHAAVEACRGRGYPVWVGGHHRRVRHVVEVADGWNGWGGDLRRFAREAASVRQVAADATLTWGGLVLVGRDDAHVAEKAARLRPGPGVLTGGPEAVAGALRGYRDAGAAWAILAAVDATDPENARILGSSVRPLLAG